MWAARVFYTQVKVQEEIQLRAITGCSYGAQGKKLGALMGCVGPLYLQRPDWMHCRLGCLHFSPYLWL